MSNETLEEQVRRINDIAEISKLKNIYLHYNDSGFQAEKIGELFAEDGVWDGGDFGRYEGRQQIIDFFSNVGEAVPFCTHLATNEIIEVNGDRATGRWRLLLAASVVGEDTIESRWYLGDYKDVFVKRNGKWMFESLNAFWNFNVKQGESWTDQGQIRPDGKDL